MFLPCHANKTERHGSECNYAAAKAVLFKGCEAAYGSNASRARAATDNYLYFVELYVCLVNMPHVPLTLSLFNNFYVQITEDAFLFLTSCL